jgi:hypothetical protein
LSRAAFFIDMQNEETLYSAAVGQLQDNFHVPFLKEYFEKVVSLAEKTKVTPNKERRHMFHTGERHEAGVDTFDFVEAKYGLTKKDLAEFCGLLAEVNTLPVTITWEPLVHCLKVDSA